MAHQIATWKVEHVNFLRLLDLLDAEIRAFHEGRQPNYDLALDVVYYLIHYPDRFHHPKEDVAMERLLKREPEIRSLATEFMLEHKIIADSGNVLLQQLQGVVDGAMIPRVAVEGPAATYASYYRRHMAREEAELFPRVEQGLKSSDWSAVEKAIPSEKDPLFGQRVEQRYAALRRQIASAAGSGSRTP